MASSASCSGNKWVKFCMEHVTDVSSFADTLSPNDEAVSMEDIGIPENELQELQQHLRTVILGPPPTDDVLGRVCQFVSKRAARLGRESPAAPTPKSPVHFALRKYY